MNGSPIVRVSGTALVLPGDDIDTDRIMPARFLKAITFEGLESHVFEDDRKQAAERGQPHAFDDPSRRQSRVLIVGRNFGCGSSREHAPQAIRRRGIRAVIGHTFAEIFLSNSVAIGLACVTAPAGDADAIRALAATGAVVEVDLQALQARVGDRVFAIALPESARHALVTGEWDATGLLLRDYDEVERQ